MEANIRKYMSFSYKLKKDVLGIIIFLTFAAFPLFAEAEDMSYSKTPVSGKQEQKELNPQKIYFFGGFSTNNKELLHTGSYSVMQFEHQFKSLKELWSVSYINEGQFSDPKHHRDGFAGQYWLKKGFFSAGAGAYLYYDTTEDGSNVHGLGGILSLNGELPITANLSANLRTNLILARDMNTVTLLAGLSYNFAPEKEFKKISHEITIFPVGGSYSGGSYVQGSSFAYSAEYRLNIFKNLDWTIGYLDEEIRNGINTQLWAIKRLDNFSIGIGAGIYFADKTDVIISVTAEYDLSEKFAARATWSRITTDNNNDADVVLVGLGYKF